MTLLYIWRQDYFLPLLLTLISELVVLCFFKPKAKKLFIVLIITNILTNPMMNRLSVIYRKDIHLALLEVAVVFIEALIYYLFLKSFKKAFLISLICNVASFLIGMLLMPYLY